MVKSLNFRDCFILALKLWEWLLFDVILPLVLFRSLNFQKVYFSTQTLQNIIILTYSVLLESNIYKYTHQPIGLRCMQSIMLFNYSTASFGGENNVRFFVRMNLRGPNESWLTLSELKFGVSQNQNKPLRKKTNGEQLWKNSYTRHNIYNYSSFIANALIYN